MTKKFIVALILCLFLGHYSFSDEATPPMTAALLSDHKTVVKGQTITFLVDVKLADDWHAYWKNPGDTGMAPEINWELPPGIEVISCDWPAPERFEQGDLLTFGYTESIPLLITLRVNSIPDESPIKIKASLQSIICSQDTCMPAISEIETELEMGPAPKLNTPIAERIALLREELPKKVVLEKVHHKDDFLYATLPFNGFDPKQSVLFFPESDSGIDIHTPVAIAPLKTKGETILMLKTSGDVPPKLKGILVVGGNSYELDSKKITTQSTDLAVATIDLNKKQKPEADQPAVSETEPLSVMGLATALFFALLGGLILNLMPCVLPVVSLKIMHFVQMAGESRSALIKQGLLFALGVLVSFWTLAALLLLLQQGGQAVGWGFQLQEPIFIAALAMLFTILGLNLFGVFEMGTHVAAIAGEMSQQTRNQGAGASFWSGVFATAVATPCTGPFMGSALGYAMSQPAYVSFAVFTFLGIGMSLPFVLIGFYPSLIRWLPKPGAWMESFKQFLGFLMLATVIWLLWVFTGQTSEQALFLMLFALLIASISAWIYGRFGAIHRPQRVRFIGYSLATFTLILALGIVRFASYEGPTAATNATSNQATAWEPFSAERLAELRRNKTPVLIDFTAKWCLICQANHIVLNSGDVSKKLDDSGVVRMIADWTKYDPEITAELKKHGRSGVPLYVLYGEDEKPAILPQVLTPDTIISSIEQTGNSNAHVR